jgi:hypothetical protein
MIGKLMVLFICLLAVQTASANDGDFRKTAGIINFENNTFYEDADVNAATIDNYIMEELENNCPDVIFRKMKRPLEAETQNVAFSGRSMGANAIVRGEITDIRGAKEELGFWFFESVVYYAEVHILIEIYDTETTAKLFMTSFEDEIEIDKNQFESLQSRTASGKLPDVTQSLKYLSEIISEEVCITIKDEPFKTYISSVNGDIVNIASGSNAGLAEGVKLIAYGVQEDIKGKTGEVFYFPGPEIGEIEISSVTPESSEGRIISGEVVAVNTCVKEKKKECWFWSIW